MTNKKTGRLFIISAPSGAGKSTVIRHMLSLCGDLFFSVSVTTRPPREGETDGIEYYFKSKESFEKMIERGEFFEYAEYAGNYYGTPKISVFEHMDAGEDVILEIEVVGHSQVKSQMPDACSIFIIPPSMEELERRLRSRGTDSDEKILQRLAVAKEEMAETDKYDFVIVNDDIERAAEEILAIIKD